MILAKKIIVFSGALFFAASSSNAQDIHFSQYEQAPLTLNPAKAGVYDGYYRFITNYRTQWGVMGKPYRTFGASFDKPWIEGKAKKAYIGTGIDLFSDRAGDASFGMTEAKISISAIVPMNDFNKVSVGIYGGAAQGSVRISTIKWGNQYNGQTYDPTISSNENGLTSFVYGDFGAGVMYEFSNVKNSFVAKDIIKVNAGFALFHVNTPRQEFLSSAIDNLEMKYVGHANVRYDFPGSKMSVCPSVIYLQQGPASEINGGLLLRMQLSGGTKVTGFFNESALLFGTNFRYRDALSFLRGFD